VRDPVDSNLLAPVGVLFRDTHAIAGTGGLKGRRLAVGCVAPAPSLVHQAGGTTVL
jgi:hypothetical protein